MLKKERIFSQTLISRKIQLFVYNFPGITTTTTPTPPQIEQETRVPKVLNGWFENPYVIKQKPNFEAVIEASRNSAIQNMTKKLEPNVSIATEPDAFFSGKNQCCQL